MSDIVTVTMNPAIDVATSVDRVEPIHKLRCKAIERDPGGGGINVARVVRRLGAEVVAIYPAGGSIGRLLHRLVDAQGITSLTIEVAEETRESFTAFDESIGELCTRIPGILPLVETESRDDTVVEIETDVGLSDPDLAPDEQQRRHHQEQRHRQLTDHEHLSHPGARRHAIAALPNVIDDALSRRSERRQHAADERREQHLVAGEKL